MRPGYAVLRPFDYGSGSVVIAADSMYGGVSPFAAPAKTEVYVLLVAETALTLTNVSGLISGTNYNAMTSIASGTTPDGLLTYYLYYRSFAPGHAHPGTYWYRWTTSPAMNSGATPLIVRGCSYRFDDTDTINYSIGAGSSGTPTTVTLPAHTAATAVYDAAATVAGDRVVPGVFPGATWTSPPWDISHDDGSFVGGLLYQATSGDYPCVYANKDERTTSTETRSTTLASSTVTLTDDGFGGNAFQRWVSMVITGSIAAKGGFHLGRIGMGSNF